MWFAKILVFEYGKTYGITGKNGTGKTLFFKSIAMDKLKLPKSISILLVEKHPPIEKFKGRSIFLYFEK